MVDLFLHRSDGEQCDVPDSSLMVFPWKQQPLLRKSPVKPKKVLFLVSLRGARRRPLKSHFLAVQVILVGSFHDSLKHAG